MIARAAVALLLVAPAAAASPTQRVGEDKYDLRAGAWDRSVALERAGRLREARALLVRAWGPQPVGYEVSVRLAWLSLRLGDAARAVREYRRARSLPGAGPEATRGLASSLTLQGYEEREAGDNGAAREHWRAALALDPSQKDARKGLVLARPQRIDPELWAGYIGEWVSGKRDNGFSVFALLPLQLSDHFRVRAAYRFSWLDVHGAGTATTASALSASAMGPGGGQGSGSGPGPGSGSGPGPGSGMGNGQGAARGTSSSGQTPWQEHDAYLGFGFGGASAWLDLLGMALFPSDERAVPGQASQLRLGRRFGVDAMQATLRRERGWNGQVAPHLFAWPFDWLRLSAGPRFTFDDQGSPVSGEAAVAVVTRPFELYLRGHTGTQRWPVSPSIPLVLTTDQDMPLGGAVAVLLSPSPHWAFGLSGELQELSQGDVHGTYASLSAGLRWSPALLQGEPP